MPRISLIAVTIFIPWVGGCAGGDAEDGPPAGTATPMPVHCWSTDDAAQLHPLSGDTLAVSYKPELGLRTLFTEDEGRTYEVAVGTHQKPRGAVSRSPLQASTGVFAVDDAYYVSLNTIDGVQRFEGTDPDQVARALSWLVIGKHGGEAQDRMGERTTIPLETGPEQGLLWEIDEQRRVAGVDFWLYASHDAGATWKVIGWKSPDHQLPEGPLRLVDSRKDRLLLEHPTHGTLYTVRPGQRPVELRLDVAREFNYAPINTKLFGDSVVYTRVFPKTAVVELLIQPIDGGEPQVLPWPADAATDPEFLELADGTLWVLPKDPSVGGFARIRPGQTPLEFEHIALDFEAAGFEGVRSAVQRPDGRILFSAYSAVPTVDDSGGEQANVGKASRHFSRTLLCELGDGVEQGMEAVVTEPIGAAVNNPGQAVRIARFREGTVVSDRFRRTPSGRVYATSGNQVRLGPPDVRPLYNHLEDPGPNAVIKNQADTFLVATDDVIQAVFWSSTNLVVPFPSHLVTWSGVYGELENTEELVFGNEQVFDVQDLYGVRFLTTQNGVFSQSELFSKAGPETRSGLPSTAIVGEGYGVVFSQAYQFERGVRASDTPAYLQRFEPLRGRMPDGACAYENELADTCIPLDDADVVAARFASNGDLYVLDRRHGRVMVLPVGDDDGAGWIEVADGFLTPSDLRLTVIDGHLVVMVYDGDVFAFVPEANEVVNARARRPEAPSPAVLLADSVGRDFRGCPAAGPCIDLAGAGGSLSLTAGGGTLCAPGSNFGEAEGTALYNGRPVQPTSWTDNEVCVPGSALSLERDGLLTVVDTQGVQSAPIPVQVPSVVTSWDLPEVVTPSTSVFVHGRNFQEGVGLEVTGAMVRSAQDDTLDLVVPGSALVRIAIDGVPLDEKFILVTPEFVRGCRSAASQPCVVTALGLDGLFGTATIGGRPAEVLRWEPPQVTLAWPVGLAPGEYPVELIGADTRTSGQVVLETQPTTVLIDRVAFPLALTYLQPRPVWTAQGLLMGGTTYSQYSPSSVVTGIRPTDTGILALRRSLNMPAGNVIQIVELPDQTLAIGPAAAGTGGQDISRLTASDADGSFLAGLPLGGVSSMGDGLAGAGVVDGGIVAAFTDTAALETRIAEIQPPEEGSRVFTRVPLVTLPGIAGRKPGASFGANRSHAAWVVDNGVYLGSCHNLGEPLSLRYVPVARDTEGALEAGAAVTIVDGTDPGTVGLTCAPTPDGGFAWVARDAAGERLFTWNPGTPGAPTEVLTLPTSLAGVGQTDSDDVPGVVDVIAGDGGDWLFLIADRETQTHGLRVVRWQASNASWHASEPFGTSTQVEPGELCVGPVPATQCAEGLGQHGCAPFACPVLPRELQSRPATNPQEGYLVRDPGDATLLHVIYEVTNLDRTPGFLLGGTEVQHRMVDTP